MSNKFLNDKQRDKLMTLSTLIRYNNSFHIRNESVAEHSFYVAFYTMKICSILQVNSDVENLALKTAIIHDVHESELSDIPHDIKANNKQIEDFCLEFEKSFNKKYFPEIDKSFSSISEDEAKLVKIIVELADIIDVLQFARHEIKIGNSHFRKIYDIAQTRITNDLEALNNICDEQLVTNLTYEIFY